MIGQSDRNTEEAKPSAAPSAAQTPLAGGRGVKKGAPVGGAASLASAATSTLWKVPSLSENWSLDEANQTALERAKDYMNGILGRDDMRLELKKNPEVPGIQGEGAVPDVTGEVLENNTGRVVSCYKGCDVLKFYAHSTQGMGIMVDGTV